MITEEISIINSLEKIIFYFSIIINENYRWP